MIITLCTAVLLILGTIPMPVSARENRSSRHTHSRERKVLAFYYTWYGTPKFQGRWMHWDEGGHTPTTTDSRGWPDIGATNHPLKLYDSNDPAVIREHLKMSADAGIDVLIATWWGKDEYHDRAFRKVIREAENSPVQVTVYYERVPSAQEQSRLVDAVVGDFQYILDSYAGSPAFFKVDGKPVVFIYGRAMHQLGKDAWFEVVKRLKAIRPVLLIGDSMSAEWADVFDGLHTYNPVGAVIGGTDMPEYYERTVRMCRSAGKISAATVIPGYDDSHIGRSAPIIADREGGNLYRFLMAAAIRSDPDWLVITSFNEWHEGSEIEPSREHGRLYLELTRKYSIAFKSEQAVGTETRTSTESPDGLVHALTAVDGSGHLLSNLDSRRGTIRVSARSWRRPVVFEIGREGRFLRRIYPAISGGTLSIRAKPFTDYAIYASAALVDMVIQSVCGRDPRGLTESQKLKALQDKLRDLDASSSEADGAARHSKRLVSHAYQILLGIEFRVEMDYKSDVGGDYKVFTGRDFHVTFRVSNRGSEPISRGKFTIFAPDDWASSADWPTSFNTVPPGESTISRFKVRAPAKSTFRPETFPLIGTLTILYNNSELVLHYPVEVTISDPFTAALAIGKALPDKLEAAITLRSAYGGLEMKGISAYPFWPRSIAVEPARQILNLRRKKTFRLDYLRKPDDAPTLRAVTMVMKLDDHIVRLRTVMEAAIDLGIRTRASGIWMNECPDGVVAAAIEGGRKCRKTVANPAGAGRYVYFAVSSNFPIMGSTYITVTYYDGENGSFTLQYDSVDETATMQGAYKDCGDIVEFTGTQTWKQKTFVVDDARFSGRQNAKPDFRLAILDGDLAVAEVVVSKFPARGTE